MALRYVIFACALSWLSPGYSQQPVRDIPSNAHYSAGEQGWEEFRDAWKVITTSEEVRDMVAAGFTLSRELLGRGSEILAGFLGDSQTGAKLRPVA